MEYRLKIGFFCSRRELVWPKLSGTRGRPQQAFFVYENWNKSSFMRYKNVGTSFFLSVTMHAFDRQTDGRMDVRTEISCNTVCCITCSRTVKDCETKKGCEPVNLFQMQIRIL